MTAFLHRYGPTALVTGASSGIGAAFARKLAARGFGLVLVARRKDRLDALAAELGAAHGVSTRVVEVDLAEPEFQAILDDATRDLDIGLVVNNAGFGDKGPFLDRDLTVYLEMLAVNCRAPLIIAHTFGRRLAQRGRGGMIFTSSTAAFQGTPWTAHYAATKGYDLLLAEGLFHELREAGVDVLALCPGATDTEGPKRTGVDASKVPVGIMDPAVVADEALAGLGRDAIVIPGLVNRLGHLAVRLTPRKIASQLAGRMIRRVTGG
jgi:hypothetical protein